MTREPAARRQTVLLAEDDPGVRAVVRALLERAGYAVLAASSGAEALALARRGAPPIDLLLTDVVMPGMGGRDLATAFARIRPDAPVVYMSGYTDDAIVRSGTKEFALLEKPFTAAELSRAVRAALDARLSKPG